MESKECRICGKIKPLSEYGFRNKKRGWYCSACKECNREYYREYRKAHIERIRENARKYVASHRAEHNEYNKRWSKENVEKKREWAHKKMLDAAYREKINERKRIRYYKVMSDEKNREKRNEYSRNLEREKRKNPDYRAKMTTESIKRRNERIKVDAVFKASIRIRNLIRTSLKSNGYTKRSRTYEIIGCDYDTLWEHLKQSWLDNYGQEWNGEPYHIDHIIPLATAKTEQDIINLCHYTNLQLLTPFDNMSKHDKLPRP